MDARLKLCWLFAVGALVILLDGALGLCALAAVSLVLLVRDGGLSGRRTALFVLGLLWSTGLSQGLFYQGQPRTALVEWGPLSVSREGVFYGWVQALRWISVGASGLWVGLRTSSDQLSAALVAFGLPKPVAFLSSASLRVLPLIFEDLKTIRWARANRRAPSPWGLNRLREESALLRPWVARSLRRSAALADSLWVRGFSPGDTRVRASLSPLSPLERLAIVGLFLVIIGLFGLKTLYTLYLWDLAYWPELRPLYAFIRRCL